MRVCSDTGYRVRVLTKERYTVSDMDSARAVWKVDKNTVILVFDPSAPNIFGYGKPLPPPAPAAVPRSAPPAHHATCQPSTSTSPPATP